MVESTRVDAAESVECISSEMAGVTRNGQPALKEHCLRRGGRNASILGTPIRWGTRKMVFGRNVPISSLLARENTLWTSSS